MIKDNEKIVITRKLDPELYDLIDRIEVIKYGKIHFHFDSKDLKELQMQEEKPVFVIVEETIKLSKI